MEELNNYSIRGYNLSIWFFRLVLLIFTTIAILLFVLQINETVSIREGEIVSSNPQSDYKAPFEGQLVKIKVREGQQINTGDTLMIMQNVEYITQQAKKKTEIEYLEKRIESINILQDALQKKKSAIDQESQINAQKYQLELNRLTNAVKILDEQYAYQKQRLLSANEKYYGDSILYKKDMLSKSEFNNTKDANLILKENISNLKSEQQKQLSEKNLATNNFLKEQNSFSQRRLELDENEQALLQSKNDLESQLLQAKDALKEIETELNKQNIIAATSGVVNYVFNSKQSSNLISKGDLLISIAPKAFSYYAKTIIPQKDIQYVKAGLDARLKLDAYYHLQHGLIKGKVSYIAERKENEKFYALIQLAKPANFLLKSGYSVQGEIIVARMPLYKFFIKKLFKSFDTK
jgi:multidrug resistance efflux pump